MSRFDSDQECIGNTATVYMAIGIVLGMKMKGASPDEIAKACEVLEAARPSPGIDSRRL
jgi:hypothetical protein